MRLLKQPGVIMVLILSLTLVSLELDNLFPQSIKSRTETGKPVNILLMGIDARPGEATARSDAIVLASLDRELEKVVLLWIPRDTRITLEGQPQKINMVNQIKGPEATCKEVGKLLGVGVDHYIRMNFTGFEQMIDALGGVYLSVDVNIPSASSSGVIKKGPQLLNGKQALEYARYRGGADADIGRTKRQQKLAKAVLRQVMRPETLPKLTEMAAIVQENVDTNISAGDMIYLLRMLLSFKQENIITQTLPGYHYINPYTGASYWEVDPHIATSILDSLFQGHQFDVYNKS